MPSPSASSGSSCAAMSASVIASIRPNAIDEFVMRVAVTVASGGRFSRHSSLIESACSSEPPSSSSGMNSPLFSVPKRVTPIEPQPPTGFEWQLWQFDLFMIGPRPLAGVNGVAYEMRPPQKRSIWTCDSPSSGAPAFGCSATPPADAREHVAIASRLAPKRSVIGVVIEKQPICAREARRSRVSHTQTHTDRRAMTRTNDTRRN